MAHIAFFPIPFAGHVNPMLGVAAELVGRGHRVTFAATAEFSQRIEETGSRVAGYSTAIELSAAGDALAAVADRLAARDLTLILRGQLVETVSILPQLASAFMRDRPDLVVYDPSCWAGRLLAARWGIPAIQSQPSFACNEQWSLGTDHAVFDTTDPKLPPVLKSIRALFARLRIDISIEDFFADPAPALVYIPRAFQYAGETFRDDIHFVGPCIGPRAFLGTWRPPQDDRPVILVSLGTTYNGQPDFFRACIRAFADATWHTVITVGSGVDPADLGPAAPNVEIHRFLPQLEVLRRATVFVNHAGMGTAMESLYSGVPIVAIPQIAEQRAVADRIVELGLGVQLGRHTLDWEALREAVDSVHARPEVTNRARAMRDEVRAAGGAPAAAAVIEARLAGRPAREHFPLITNTEARSA